MDPAMRIGVVSLLPPVGQGWVRCAGQQGIIIFQDCIECNTIPYYAEVCGDELKGGGGMLYEEHHEEVVVGPTTSTNTPRIHTTTSMVDIGTTIAVVAPTSSDVSMTITTTPIIQHYYSSIQCIPVGDGGGTDPWKPSSLLHIKPQPQPHHFIKAVLNWTLFRTHGRLQQHSIHTTTFTSPKIVHVVNCDNLMGLFYWLMQLQGAPCGEMHISVSNTIDIPPSFFADIHPHLQTLITSITFSEGCCCISALERAFMCGCTTLKYFDMSPFEHVSEIPAMFVRGCASLVEIPNLSKMKRVKRIGSQFLSGCSSIPTINLDPFINVSHINVDFMRDCISLTTLSLDGLRNVTHIGNGFLFGCCSLSPTIDLSAMVHLEVIGDGFLGRCSGLTTTLDLQPLSNTLRRIGTHFLQECSGLSSLDLEPLRGIQHVPAYFLYGCRGLQELDFTPIKHTVVELHGFLEFCDLLRPDDILVGVKHCKR